MALRTISAREATTRPVLRPASSTPRTTITYKFSELPEGLRRTNNIKNVFPRSTFTLDDLLKYAEANPNSKLLPTVVLWLYFKKGDERGEIERQDRFVLIDWVGNNLENNLFAQELIRLRHPVFFTNRNLDEKMRIASSIGHAAKSKKVQRLLKNELEVLGQKISSSCISVPRFSSLANVSEGLWADFANIAAFLPNSPFKRGMLDGLPVGTVVVRERK